MPHFDLLASAPASRRSGLLMGMCTRTSSPKGTKRLANAHLRTRWCAVMPSSPVTRMLTMNAAYSTSHGSTGLCRGICLPRRFSRSSLLVRSMPVTCFTTASIWPFPLESYAFGCSSKICSRSSTVYLASVSACSSNLRMAGSLSDLSEI